MAPVPLIAYLSQHMGDWIDHYSGHNHKYENNNEIKVPIRPINYHLVRIGFLQV